MIAQYITYSRGAIVSNLTLTDKGEILEGIWNHKNFTPEMININSFGRRVVGCKGQIFRLVWIAFNGPIPKGYVVHHIDHNKLNDSLDNLMLMTKSEHAKHHNKYTSFGKYDKSGENNPSYEEAVDAGYIYSGCLRHKKY